MYAEAISSSIPHQSSPALQQATMPSTIILVCVCLTLRKLQSAAWPVAAVAWPEVVYVNTRLHGQLAQASVAMPRRFFEFQSYRLTEV